MAGPRLAQTGPRLAGFGHKNTPKGDRCLRGVLQELPLSLLMDKIPVGKVWVAFRPCSSPFGSETVFVGPKIGPLGPRARPVGQNRKMAVSWARQTKSRIRGHFSHVQTLNLGGIHPAECPKHTNKGGFWSPGARLAAFWRILARVGAPQRGPKWANEMRVGKEAVVSDPGGQWFDPGIWFAWTEGTNWDLTEHLQDQWRKFVIPVEHR